MMYNRTLKYSTQDETCVDRSTVDLRGKENEQRKSMNDKTDFAQRKSTKYQGRDKEKDGLEDEATF